MVFRDRLSAISHFLSLVPSHLLAVPRRLPFFIPHLHARPSDASQHHRSDVEHPLKLYVTFREKENRLCDFAFTVTGFRQVGVTGFSVTV